MLQLGQHLSILLLDCLQGRWVDAQHTDDGRRHLLGEYWVIHAATLVVLQSATCHQKRHVLVVRVESAVLGTLLAVGVYYTLKNLSTAQAWP